MSYIDIRLNFTLETEDDYTYHNLSGVTCLAIRDIPNDSIAQIVEGMAQSDDFYIETTNQILDSIERFNDNANPK